MKKYNKFLNIFNIFYSVVMLLIFVADYFFYSYIYTIYEYFGIALLKITPIAIIVFYVIISVINFKKKNKKNGIIRYINSCQLDSIFNSGFNCKSINSMCCFINIKYNKFKI